MSRRTRAEQLTEKIRRQQYDMWQALEEIDRDKLWAEMGYNTQATWAVEEFGWTPRFLRYQIEAAGTAILLQGNYSSEDVKMTALPTAETQLRPLAALPEPERKIEAWQAAVELANEASPEGQPLRPPTAKQVEAVVREMTYKPPPPIPSGEFNVILADPPWQFANSGMAESAASHYPTMATEELCKIDTPKANVLFLWAVNAMLPDALEVMRAWGFDYKANIVWAKDKGPSIGWFVQSRHELLLIGTRGSISHPEWKPVSWFQAKTTEHSRKPDMAYGFIEKMYDGPYLELFARNKRVGWESWGNEI